MRWISLAMAVAALSGCADYNLVDAQYERYNGEPLEDDGWDDSTVLRLDVHPAQIDAALPALSQTFWVDHLDGTLDGSPVELRLSDPVLLSGYVTAYQVTPWSGADLPGEDGPVEAEVSLLQAGSAQNLVVSTDTDGFFQTRVVPDEGYALAITPATPDVPASILDVDVLEDLDLDLDLGQGTALYGQVTLSDGQPMEGARVMASADQVSTAWTHTDRDGWYLLWVQDDLEWSVICAGQDDGRDPTLTLAPRLVAGDALRQDVSYPSLDAVTVIGRVLDSSGQPAEQALVRLVAESLDDFEEGASLEREVYTGSKGNFDIVVLPGTWTVEVEPPEVQPDSGEITRSPVSMQTVQVVDDLDLGRIELPPFVSVYGIVTDPTDQPVPGALLRLTEADFSGRSWSLSTADDGTFSVSVPQVELDLTLTPPSNRSTDLAMTRMRLDPAEVQEPNLRLEQGQRLRGTVRDAAGEVQAWAVVEVRSEDDQLLAVTLTDEQGQFDVGVAP